MAAPKNAFRFFTTAAILIIVIPVIATLVILFWYKQQLHAVSADTTKQMFEIKQGETGAAVVNDLQKTGLIRSSLAFRIFTKKQGISEKFAEGVYYLSPSMDVPTLAQQLLHGQSDAKITVIEGWRNEQIAQILQDQMTIDPKTFLAAAKQGYMFPDTYLLNKKEAVADVVQTMQTNFDKRVTPDTQAQIKSQKITVDDGITIASIVEREARDSVPNERQMIASIILKRLRMKMALQVDATIQYQLGYDPIQKKWWRELSEDDLKKPSPYNTYLNVGLPPTPICNPGLASITAVAQATDTPYLYYLHGKDGTVHFAKTLDEHNANKAKYL